MILYRYYNLFLNWTTLYSDDCVIGMDLNDWWKGAFADKIKLLTVLVRYVHENVIVDFRFVAAATIDFGETVVHERLTVAGESENVSVSKGIYILRNMLRLKTNAPGE